ncbi:hypothetical protein OESDEN_08252 [Oesophagostomum dentatum]|uniref:EGF-like domain-containing protein n=1 Tax=Oesophagostomum dentatum TaxID=61180 RepID=A0A0B1T7T0_OESDE|nr:hypothetical protein OESDEN_08252 [Oesophagostomum dentatum]
MSEQATFECINTIANPGYKCICQLGFVKNDLGQCSPVNMSTSKWHGFAYSEPHPRFASKLSVLLPLIMAILIVD